LQVADKGLGVVLVSLLYAEVVDNEAEGDRALDMGEQPRGVGGGYITVLGKMGLKTIVCQDPCLLKAVHSLPDFDHDVIVVDERREIVLCHDVSGNVLNWDAHVFLLHHQSV
jgi:hypothetical protein